MPVSGFVASIKARAVIVCSIAFVASIAGGGTSVVISDRLAEDVQRTEAIAIALRNHTLTDMVHDGLRSVVYASLSAKEIGKPDSEIEEDLSELLQTLKQASESRASVDLPPALKALANSAESDLSAYAASVKSIVATAQNDRARAIAMIPAFDAQFKALADRLEKIGDQLQDASAAIRAESQRNVAFAKPIEWGAMLLSAGALAWLVYFVIRGLVRPLEQLRGSMRRLAAMQYDTDIPYVGQQNELGEMARAVDQFRVNGLERQRLELAMAETRRREIDRQKFLEVEAKEFKTKVGKVIDALNAETSRMRGTSETLGSVAQTALEEAASASEASFGAADSSRAVAASANELASAIREIAEQTSKTGDIVEQATELAHRVDADVSSLSEAAREIRGIVELINGIAGQTNLLALNATIEAARAGESGRGFAVVAQEVKQLAEQTAKATETITQKVEGIEQSTQHAVNSIRTVTARVAEINGMTGAVAAAVEQQNATTADIGRHVTSSAESSQSAAASAERVKSSAAKTSAEADAVKAAVGKLASVVSAISDSVADFLAIVGTDIEERRKAVRSQGVDEVSVRIGTARKTVAVVDVSLLGLRLRSDDLKVGQTPFVTVDGKERRARVIWVENGEAGLAYEDADALAVRQAA